MELVTGGCVLTHPLVHKVHKVEPLALKVYKVN